MPKTALILIIVILIVVILIIVILIIVILIIIIIAINVILILKRGGRGCNWPLFVNFSTIDLIIIILIIIIASFENCSWRNDPLLIATCCVSST